MDLDAVRGALGTGPIDAWLLYDFRGQNPTAVGALGLGGHMLTRRWFFLVPRTGEPRMLVHAIEKKSLPAQVPGVVESYSSWSSLETRLKAMLAGCRTVAMEYCPRGAIPYLSRVDAGTIELVRSLGVDVVSSADLVQHCLCRWSAGQVESHERASRVVNAAKDEAFDFAATEIRAGRTVRETDVQRRILDAFARGGLVTDHAPIAAVNAHAGDPHYVPGERTPTPVRKGDLVLIDLWAKLDAPEAVYSDITWVGFAGEQPSPKMEEIFRITADARDRGLAMIAQAHREGRTLKGFEVDRVVRDYIESKGYGDRFLHRTGHNIGAASAHGDGANLDDHETHDTRELVVGLGFSIEPGIYLDDIGVRSEIDVFLGATGPQVFTPIQQEIVRLRV